MDFLDDDIQGHDHGQPFPAPPPLNARFVTTARGSVYPAPSTSSSSHPTIDPTIADRVREISETLAQLQADLSGHTLPANSSNASMGYSSYHPAQRDVDLLGLGNMRMPTTQQPDLIRSSFAIPPMAPTSNYYHDALYICCFSIERYLEGFLRISVEEKARL